MPPQPLPHRVTVLPPVIALAPEDEPHAQLFADLLAAALFEHLVRHPVVSVIDPQDRNTVDDEGRLLNAEHPRFADSVRRELIEARRDEVLWFELTLDLSRPSPTRLLVRGPSGKIDAFSATAQKGAVSGPMANCLSQWLADRQLPAPPRPLEPFTVEELHTAVDWADQLLEAMQADPAAAPALLAPPPGLIVPFYRALQPYLDGQLRREIDKRILQVETDNPVSRRNDLVYRLEHGRASRSEVRMIVETSPQWGKPHLSMHGDDIAAEDALRHQGIAALLMPTSPWALDNFAITLIQAGRHDEAWRVAARATVSSPRFVRAHVTAIRAAMHTRRAGFALLEAEARSRALEELQAQGGLDPSDDLRVRRVRGLLAEAHFSVGRIDDAIGVGKKAIDGLEDPHAELQAHVDDLNDWENQPEALALAYAREGHYRRDPGRVLAGFSRARPRNSVDVAMFVDAFVALGKEDLAALAFAHLHGAGVAREPIAWLAGARAYLMTGELGRALELVQRAQLRFPQARLESEINRVLRLAATRPAAEWEAIIAEKTAAGAHRLAALLARDACDFVPGLAADGVAAQAAAALAEPNPAPFDPASVEPLRDLHADVSLGPIDAFFAAWSTPSLDAADRLAASWLTAITAEAGAERAAEVLFLTAHALTRYLAATAQGPNPLAGGLRQVATDGLNLLGELRGEVKDRWLRPFLAALDAVPGVDPWVYDSWILRVERALDIDGRTGGHLGPVVGGLRRIEVVLRGEERIAFEQRLAEDLRPDRDCQEPARELFERSFRAIGSEATATAWSELADASLPTLQALDVHWTATVACPSSAVPWTNVIRSLLSAGRAELAFDTLCQAPPPGRKARERTLANPSPAWEYARLGMPREPGEAQYQGETHLKEGRADKALLCFRWLRSLDRRNTTALKGLVSAYARLGRTLDVLATCAEFDGEEAATLTGRAFLECRTYGPALLAYRYGALWNSTPGEWWALVLGAWHNQDAETAALAYEKLHTMLQGRLGLSELYSFATALLNAGLPERAEQIAKELIDKAAGDEAYIACGLNALARALLAQKRDAEAVTYARMAVAKNTVAANTADFAETQARAERGEPFPARPLRATQPRTRAFAALEAGDLATVRSLLGTALDWPIRRAALIAAELRGPYDNLVPVSEAASAVAAQLLEATTGQLDPEAALCRVLALEIREDAQFPVDPPPPLGAPVTRARFEAMFAERLEEDEPTLMREVPAGAQALTMAEGSGAPMVVAPAEAPADGDDPVVFPGSKVARLSQYVLLMKGLKGSDPMGALAKLGLDMGAFAQVSSEWTARLESDPALGAKLKEKLGPDA